MKIEEILENQPWSHWGFSRLERPLSFDLYHSWLKKGLHGKMAYLERHERTKESPQDLSAEAKSAIAVARSYLPHPYELEDFPLRSVNIAKYARGADYHHSFSAELGALAQELAELFPEHSFQHFTDSAPIMERDLAYRAGLGWFGKNSCLIDRKKGSFFLLGEIYTSIELESQAAPVKDFCGSCSRCSEACPTDAIIEGRQLDARKCISYLTIETSDIPDESLREAIGENLFGCDICQDVCPWNRKVMAQNPQDSQLDDRNKKVQELQWILKSSNKALQKSLRLSALSRAAGNKLKRNALVYIGNGHYTELASEVEGYLSHSLLGELAHWCLRRLGKSSD